MNLNEIQLPARVIIDLYKKSLIESPDYINETNEVSKNDPILHSFQYFGDNLKNILIIVSYHEQQFLPDEQRNFLSIVLNACHLNIADVAIINFAKSQPDIQAIKKQIDPKFMLVFGLNSLPFKNSDPFIELEPTKFEGIMTVCAPALERLNQNDNEGKILKKRLWAILKQLLDVR